MPASRSVEEVIAAHEASGKYFSVNGIKTFVLRAGRGEAVFCIHGVPTSSFLYRKVITSLSRRGYRGICVDLPGFGLSERPSDFDYTFRGYATFLHEATRALRLRKFHLVVHDIGGPIGFALAAMHPDRILSLTILNTWIDVVNFKKPAVMKPFDQKILGQAELKLITHLTWPVMFRTMGVSTSKIPLEEINAYVDLLKREDNGKAFLRVMRSYDRSPEFRELCYRAVQKVPYPVQAIWGEKDPALTWQTYGEEIRQAAGLKEVSLLPAKHFLQEEVWLALSDKIVELAQGAHQV